jgi:4-alpha-glucanotransferase
MSRYLELVTAGTYRFKEEFKTQRQLESYARNNSEILELNSAFYNEILSLYCEVLFIEDQKQKGKFHPRIAFQDTYSFRELDWGAKDALNRLYNHFFYERHNQFWAEQAMKKLPALLRATDMLVCAEDLGMIPACVPDVMRNLYMLSLEIDRMPKDPTQEFVYMDGVPYLSVCTTSTHDMSPIRGWWKEDMGLTQRYYNHILGEWGGAPEDCEPWICEKILNRHLYSPAMLVILPFQDWISIDGENRRANCDEERINIPADPHHFWCYRMHKNVEELLGLTELNEKMLQMTISSGRSVKM